MSLKFQKQLPLICRAFLVLLLAATAGKSQAEEITLETYRRQAQGNDPAYEASRLAIHGAPLAELGAEALTDTQLFLRYNQIDDQRPTQNPSFMGDRTKAHLLSLGLQKQFEFGPMLSVSQNVAYTHIENASTTAIQVPEYTDTYPEVQLTVPLWRNFWGNAVSASLDQARALAKVQRLNAEITAINSQGQIDLAYFNLQTAQENARTEKDLLDRAQKIGNWVRGQSKRGLVDSSDTYQSDAAVTLRQLEFDNSNKSLAEAARIFNDLRGQHSDQVKETLLPAPLDLESLKMPATARRAAKMQQLQESQLAAQEAQSMGQKESAKPQLDLMMKASWTDRDPETVTATTPNYEKGEPYYQVGVQFLMPIDAVKYHRIRKGYSELARSQSLLRESQRMETQRDWLSFIDLGKELYQQVQLTRKLEETQKLKSDAERRKFERGRSTTFQVLTFEQDYISARSQRIATELQARRYITQIAMYDELASTK